MKNAICREIDFMGLFTACQNGRPGDTIRINDYAKTVYYDDGTREEIPTSAAAEEEK